MVIAKIGNPIIPDTSDASRAQYEQLKKLSAEYGVDVTLSLQKVRRNTMIGMQTSRVRHGPA